MKKLCVTLFAVPLFVSAAFGATASKAATAKPRITVLSAEGGKLVAAEEAKLNHALADCAKVKVPKTCRAQAMTEHNERLSAILSKVGVDTHVQSGTFDCVGDSQPPACPNGHIETIQVTCRFCTGRCFLYVCVMTAPKGNGKE